MNYNSVILTTTGLSWLLAFFLAIEGFDKAAWIVMNCSIFLGALGTIVSWAKADHVVIGLTTSYLKICLVIYSAWGWWSFTYHTNFPYDQHSIGFFWTMSPFLFGVMSSELAIINKYFVKSSQS